MKRPKHAVVVISASIFLSITLFSILRDLVAPNSGIIGTLVSALLAAITVIAVGFWAGRKFC